MNAENKTAPLAFDESPFAVSSKEILRALYRKKWLIVASTVVVGAAVAIGTWRQPRVYQGQARLLIEPALPKVLEDDVMVDDLSERARAEAAFFNTQYQIIAGRVVLREAAAALNLAKDPAYLAAYELKGEGEALLDRIVATIHEQLTVSPERGSRIVRVVVEDRDPDRATKIANAVAQSYMDQSLRDRLQTTHAASDWLDEQVDEYKRKLEEAESALNDFRRRNMLVTVSVEDRQSMSATTLATLSQKLVEAHTERLDLEAKRQVVERAKSSGEGLEAIPRVAASALIASMKAGIHELEKKREEVGTRYGPKHDNMKAIELQIQAARTELDREIQVVLKTLDNELDALRSQEESLRRALEDEKKAAMDLSNLALEFAKLNRDHGTNKTMYESLLKRQGEAALSGRLKSNFVHWFERAEVDRSPVRPVFALNFGIGLLAGLLIGLLIVVGGVILDNTVRSQSDVEEILGLPFLGVLPSIGEGRNGSAKALEGSRDLFIAGSPSSNVAECARFIRTSLLFMGANRPLKRMLVTSAGPSEGKSTVTIGLAVTMAQAGNRVLIIDTDLRRPRLHRSFGVSSERGVTSVLLQEATLDEAIKKTEVVGLDLLPCGPLPPNPAELLHSERFARVLEQIDQRYDRIILDSPPVNAVTDSVILGRQVDGTILVIKSSKTGKDAVRRARRQLAAVGAYMLGAVLNDMSLEEGGGYNYYYYHKYAYGSDAEKSAEA